MVATPAVIVSSITRKKFLRTAWQRNWLGKIYPARVLHLRGKRLIFPAANEKN
jgi:hypothetical protein